MPDFSILTVCSGNICRSPLAEQLLRMALADLADVRVSSAGTMGMVGSPMDAQSAALAVRLGVADSAEHVARELNTRLIDDAQLIFAMSRDHRRAVAELSPRAVRRTFTIREFARIAAEVTDDDLAHVAALPLDDVSGRLAETAGVVAAMRGMVSPAGALDDDDVIDPYRRPSDVYERSVSELRPAVDSAVALFRRALTLSV
ncbi:low molecular weight phosphatase family protein [Mycetocola sp. 2940]|uniref:arsenate reductase/protein-tyrosine-phosphatase family protein n=1 Tax=Mycetocola sp. 2940 TaxID=3156452 RepID=UPI003392D330